MNEKEKAFFGNISEEERQNIQNNSSMINNYINDNNDGNSNRISFPVPSNGNNENGSTHDSNYVTVSPSASIRSSQSPNETNDNVNFNNILNTNQGNFQYVIMNNYPPNINFVNVNAKDGSMFQVLPNGKVNPLSPIPPHVMNSNTHKAHSLYNDSRSNFDPTATFYSEHNTNGNSNNNFYSNSFGYSNQSSVSLPINFSTLKSSGNPVTPFPPNKIEEHSETTSILASSIISKGHSITKLTKLEIFPINLANRPIENDGSESMKKIPWEELFKRVDELYEFPFPMLPFILPDPDKLYCADEDTPSYCYKFHFLCAPSNIDDIHFIKNCVSYGYSLPNYKLFIIENMTLLRLGLHFIVKNGHATDTPNEIKECLKVSNHPEPSIYFQNMIYILDKYLENALKSENSEVEKFDKLVEMCKNEIENIKTLILGIISNINNKHKSKKKRSKDLGVHSNIDGINKTNDKDGKHLSKSYTNDDENNKSIINSNIDNSEKDSKISKRIISMENLVENNVKDSKENGNNENKEVKFWFNGFQRINILDNKFQDRYMCVTHYLRQKIINELNKKLLLRNKTQDQNIMDKASIAKERINSIINKTIAIGKVKDMKICDLSECHLVAFPPNLIQLFGVENLNLSSNKFKDVPKEIGHFKLLKYLYLKKNQLTSVTEIIKNNIFLEHLDFSHNKIFYIAKEIGNLKFLKECNLENNKITSLPDEITNLKNLTQLKLKNNRLLSLPVNLGNLENLENITLTNNKLTYLPESFFMLNKLRKLDLKNNYLAILPEKIGKMVSLNVIILDNNKISFLPSDFSQLKNLTTLSFSHNEIKKLPESFGELSELREIDASYNKIYELPSSIRLLTHVEMMNFDYNEISYLPNGFGDLKKLKFLYLASNKLTALEDELSGLESLEEISLERNSIVEISTNFCTLPKLRKLVLESNNLSHLPNNINSLISLTHLNIAANKLVELPDNLYRLPNLKKFDLQDNNDTLTTIDEKVTEMKNLECLYINDNISRVFMENLSSFKNLKELSLVNYKYSFSKYLHLDSITQLVLHSCNISKFPENVIYLLNLREFILCGNRIKKIPKKISKLRNLKEFNISFNCVTKIPAEICELSLLEKLNLRKNEIRVLPTDFKLLKSLQELDLSYNKFQQIPQEIYDLTNLRLLNIKHNVNIISINPKICSLDKLEYLKIFDFDIPIARLKKSANDASVEFNKKK
ncbi:L domain-like protein [Neocallimastix californiae]|uniref:L domain-like protein n=1 Tax=Neocallimastix californiae TaxID=1754190 RepID=A0A1Y2DRS1_9FUNG|nr:L domain-like protein [Neocallimastix californiae]|eukprot:ORY61960.1 L domain-like protein [Neocallimastix californiae]